jgi:hypothetical protein
MRTTEIGYVTTKAHTICRGPERHSYDHVIPKGTRTFRIKFHLMKECCAYYCKDCEKYVLEQMKIAVNEMEKK